MTYDDVERAAAVLEQQGKSPSGNLVLAHLKQRGLPASKRTVLKYLRLRRPPPPAADVAAVDAPPPTGLTTALEDPEYHAPPPGPVEEVERALRLAEVHLTDARDALVHAKSYLAGTLNLPVEGVLRGSLQAGDEARAQALDDVDLCKREYDTAWSQREMARQDLRRLEQQHRRGHQERWVAAHRPQLVETLAHWQEHLRTATTDRAHAQAKKEYQTDMYQYQQAVAQAPWSANGTTA